MLYTAYVPSPMTGVPAQWLESSQPAKKTTYRNDDPYTTVLDPRNRSVFDEYAQMYDEKSFHMPALPEDDGEGLYGSNSAVHTSEFLKGQCDVEVAKSEPVPAKGGEEEAADQHGERCAAGREDMNDEGKWVTPTPAVMLCNEA